MLFLLHKIQIQNIYFTIIALFKTTLPNNCTKSRKMLFLSHFIQVTKNLSETNPFRKFCFSKEITAKRSREHIEQSYYPNGSFMSINPNLYLISPSISSYNILGEFYYFVLLFRSKISYLWNINLKSPFERITIYLSLKFNTLCILK